MDVSLTADQARAMRMRNLLLHESGPEDVAGVVEWMGAMQAQDLASGLWSFGARLPSFTVADVEAALERREALRTWPMRGTVHFVPARDARWMVEVLGARVLAAAEKRRAYHGLSARDADCAVDVLGSTLAGGGRLTRVECIAAIEAAGVDGAGQRAYHLLWYASQRGVTCIAPNVGTEQTFVLLDEWVPDPVRLGRDEALATIALRYFQSHGPAPRQDFAGWMWSTAADAKLGIAGCGDSLVEVSVEGTSMYVAASSLEAADGGSEGAVGAGGSGGEYRALPGFDEFMLGYKERSLMLEKGQLELVVPGRNGVFRSTIVREGRVVGTWKRTLGKAVVTVEVWPFGTPSAKVRGNVEASLQPYGRFVERAVEVRWP